MGLEAKVLKAVEALSLGEDSVAHFAHGTLFVENLFEDEVKLVVEAVKSVCRHDTKVIVSGPITDVFGFEYAFDIA